MSMAHWYVLCIHNEHSTNGQDAHPSSQTEEYCIGIIPEIRRLQQGWYIEYKWYNTYHTTVVRACPRYVAKLATRTRTVYYSYSKLIGRLVDWLVDWLIVLSIRLLIDWLIVGTSHSALTVYTMHAKQSIKLLHLLLTIIDGCTYLKLRTFLHNKLPEVSFS